MILPSDKEYTQTKRIILGIKKMKFEFIPFVEWIVVPIAITPFRWTISRVARVK